MTEETTMIQVKPDGTEVLWRRIWIKQSDIDKLLKESNSD